MKLKHKLAYMECAEAFAKCSVAQRLKVGSVIVKDNRIISCGYNAHYMHIDGSLEGPDGLTLTHVVHSEQSALNGLLRAGISPVGAVIFCTHQMCNRCAMAILDAGITSVYYRNEYRDSSGIEYLIRHGVIVGRV